MAKEFFTSEVCERLAHELVTEQAELIKHGALVREIKTKLIEGKELLVKKLIVGKTFLIDGKKRTVLDVSFEDYDERLYVYLTFGLYPSEIDWPQDLTEDERELLDDYCDYLFDFKDVLADWAGQDALNCARELRCHRNQMYLIRVEDYEIDLSKANTPGFFEESGIVVYEGDRSYLLEKLMVY